MWKHRLSSPNFRIPPRRLPATAVSRPLFIAIDQEGGRVARLGPPFTQFPKTPPVANAEEAARFAAVTAAELTSIGVNMNLAPVLDVAPEGFASVMAERSFGPDPAARRPPGRHHHQRPAIAAHPSGGQAFSGDRAHHTGFPSRSAGNGCGSAFLRELRFHSLPQRHSKRSGRGHALAYHLQAAGSRLAGQSFSAASPADCSATGSGSKASRSATTWRWAPSPATVPLKPPFVKRCGQTSIR